MKKITTLCILCLASISTFAQWTMNASDFPMIGNSQYYIFADTTGVTPGPAGTGQTYNYSALVPKTTSRTRNIEDPASTSSGTCCPDATVSQTDNGGLYYHFQEYGTDSISLEGEKGPTTTAVMYPEAPLYRVYPMAFGANWTDSLNAVYFDGFFTNVVRKGTLEINFDGGGTLTTPYDSYDDVNRVYHHWYIRDSSLSGLIESTIDVKIWEWYQNGKPMPVMVLKEQVVAPDGGSATYSKEIMYADSLVVGTEEAVANDGLYLSPNPASDQAALTFTNAQPGAVTVMLTDMLGRNVMVLDHGMRAGGIQRILINTSDLRKGIYLVSVQHDGKTDHTRLVVE